ncbi:MAG: tRNA (guanosine(46)-N7)-methyltransferase TrmB [Opitutaceae bacterium]|nr:tRNA (guanosine(46)-N7)-methyltransferase TrmB [Opitutaceae bacterium]
MLKKQRIQLPPEEVLQKTTLRRDLLKTICSELLPKEGAITLEIGCGHGHFLTEYAKAHPDSTCIGIDLLNGRIERADRKKDRSPEKNLHFLKAEATEFLLALPKQIQIEAYFLLFPDPWPKRRHHKNRLLDSDFLSLAAQKSSPTSPFYFRTDHCDYFEWGRKAFEAHPDWAIAPELNWAFEQTTVFQEKAESYQSLIAIKVDPAKSKEKSGKELSKEPSHRLILQNNRH